MTVQIRCLRWWIQRRHGRWNLHLPFGVAMMTAEHPRWWFVIPGLSLSWWDDGAFPLDVLLFGRRFRIRR